MKFQRVFEGAYSLHYTEAKVQANFHAPYVLGGEYKNCLFISKKGRLTGYYSKEEIDRLKLVSYALLMNKEFSGKLLQETKKVCNSIIQITKLIVAEDLTKLDNSELAIRLDLFRKEHWLNQVYFVSSMPTCTYLLEKELENFVDKKVKDKKKSQEYIIALTTPYEKTALNKEEEEYCDLVLDCIRYEGIVRITKPFSQFREYIGKNHPYIIKKIQTLLDRYRWLPTQEGNPPYDFDHYLRMLFYDLQRPKKDLIKDARFHKTKFDIFRKRRENVDNLLKVSPKIKYIAKLIRDLAHLRMQVRLARTESDFLGSPLKKEFGRRLGLTDHDIEFCTTKELSDALLAHREINKNMIRDRKEYYIWVVKDGVQNIYTGKIAEKIEEVYIDKEKESKDHYISGLPASPGKVRGYVKIISPLSKNQLRDCEAMQEGAILVTGQTRPHLMMAVRKAKAIVTDEGGICSHSALVSREYNIPCIVGTHNATKILNDNDFIEVDAYNGIIKILRKANKETNNSFLILNYKQTHNQLENLLNKRF